MTNADLKSTITEAIQPLVDMVEIIKHKNDLREVQIDATLAHVRTIRDQQSLMNKKIDELQKAFSRLDESDKQTKSVLESIKKELKQIKEKQDQIIETQESHTLSLIQLETTISGYSDMYKINEDNIIKLEKRIMETEKDLGINPPEELMLVK